MKKIIALLLLFCLCLTACSKGDGKTSPETAEKYDRYETVDFDKYDTGDDAYSINTAIEALNTMGAVAANKGERVMHTLKMPKDRYELNKSISLTGIEDVTIDGGGSTFVFTEIVSAILMTSCKNVTFKNFNIDYDPLRYTQGVVKEIKGTKVVLEIDEGYPNDIDFINGKGFDDVYGEVSFGEQTISSNIHIAEGGVKPHPPTYVFKTNAVSLGGRLVELEAHSNSLFEGAPLDYMNVGDVISLEYIGPKLLWAEKGKGGIEFIDINVWSAPGAGFWELDGEGGTLYKNVCVAPGPKPEGATRERVLAMSGDCIHSSMLKKGPTVDGCTFTYLADDALNINGTVYYVLSSEGNKTIIAPRWNYPFYEGEQVKSYESDNFNVINIATIQKCTAYNDPEVEDEVRSIYKLMDQQWGDPTLLYEVITDRPLGVKKGDYVISMDRRCSGAVIKNSTFGLNRSRGIVVKGDDILIENNTVTGTMFPSIYVQLDTSFGEGGFSSDVTIRGNKVKNSTVGKDMTKTINRNDFGAISVNILLDRNHDGILKNFSHKNIVIEDNVIDGTSVYGISCLNVDGLTIRNNKITNPFMYGIGHIGENMGVVPNSGIFVGQCMNVTVTDNTVSGGPDEITDAVQIHESVQNIKKNENNKKVD